MFRQIKKYSLQRLNEGLSNYSERSRSVAEITDHYIEIGYSDNKNHYIKLSSQEIVAERVKLNPQEIKTQKVETGIKILTPVKLLTTNKSCY